MTFELTGSVSVVDIPPSLPLTTTRFGIEREIDGTEYEFAFFWSVKNEYYVMTVRREDGVVMEQLFPEPGMAWIIENFNQANTKAPDAQIRLDGGKDKRLSPFTLGSRHVMAVLTGRFSP